MPAEFNLDQALLEITDKEGTSTWTIRDAVEGVQIFGGIGSGKTSGSGRMLALKFLSHGFGGLVLTAKPDEKEMWQEYCRLARRENDLVIIEPGGNQYFNFLDYELGDNGNKSFTENIVQVLKTVIRAGEEKSSGRSDDQFWETALDMLIFNVIDLCMLAYGRVSIQAMYDIVLSAPKQDTTQLQASQQSQSPAKPFDRAMAAAQGVVDKQIMDWIATLTNEERKKYNDAELFEKHALERFSDARLLRFIDQFFLENYKNLSDKTRSIIEFTFLGFLFRLLKEPFNSIFCSKPSTVTPEDSLKGKIIILNFPVKRYHKVGRDIQIMFKYIWQRTMENRDVHINGRPVFLWADEAQNFLHEHDAEYQATARSSRISTVYISQNLPNYHACMGGDKSEYRVKSFLGTLGTKIFHANADIETNMYASSLIGEAYSEDHSRQIQVGHDVGISKGVSYKLEKMVRPEEFVRLKTGGARNNKVVTGIMHIQGNSFANKFNHKEMRFRQDYSL